jgi:predicted ATP-dependent serine protease
MALNFYFLNVILSQQQPKMASPAFPVLGSILLQLTNDRSLSRKRKRVGVSFDPMDSALKGGVDYGRISCISGDKSQGKTTVRFSVLPLFVSNSLLFTQ